MSEFISNYLDKLSAKELGADAELIPLLSSEEEEAIEKEEIPKGVALLPLRNTVLFPGVVIPISVGRKESIKLIKDSNRDTKTIGVVAQKNKDTEKPSVQDIYSIGTLAQILRVLKMPDGNTTVIIQGKKRFEIEKIISADPYLKAEIKEVEKSDQEYDQTEFESIVESIKDLAHKIIEESPSIPSEASFAIKNIKSSSYLINFVSSNMNLSVKEKQLILEEKNIKERAFLCLKYMNIEYQKLEIKNDIQSRVRNDLDQQQKEYYLHQQMKTIQEELGGISYDEEIEEMEKKMKTKKWTKEVAKHFKKELNKLQRMNPQVAEYSVQRNYLDLFLELPWGEFSKDKFDLKKAQRVLDRDHYGLEDVKKRIIEYLAVLKLRNDMKSPILCFYGPPGVGKTSLGKSIAESLGRSYVRMSLGGVSDEAEIRGHRKTYIGALPGRIIQNIKKSKASNPVFVLDEIDKLTSNYSGDPSSALLEVLDPEQNSEFHDNYLEVGFDLSKVLFIATANSLNSIQPALLDRMEIIEVNGYTLEEKVEIAKKHLVPQELVEHGLKKKELSLSKIVLENIVESYTRESGVRGLKKQIAKTVRYAAKSIAMEEEYEVKPSLENLTEILGAPKITRDLYENNEKAGVVVGMAWTSSGGTILFIESIISKGTGAIKITGNLGKVMKESFAIALDYIKANAKELKLEKFEFNKYDICIHVPEGATPKDGPSAGITILTSLVSLLTQKRVKKNISMSGEITLRGKVLPVGGLKEKILAAKRAKIKEIILSESNRKDISEIKEDYLKNLTIHFVKEMNEVIDIAITNVKVKNSKKLF